MLLMTMHLSLYLRTDILKLVMWLCMFIKPEGHKEYKQLDSRLHLLRTVNVNAISLFRLW